MKLYSLMLVGCVVVLLSGSSKQSAHYLGYVSADYMCLSSTVAGKLAVLEIDHGADIKNQQLLFGIDPMPGKLMAIEDNNLSLLQIVRSSLLKGGSWPDL